MNVVESVQISPHTRPQDQTVDRNKMVFFLPSLDSPCLILPVLIHFRFFISSASKETLAINLFCLYTRWMTTGVMLTVRCRDFEAAIREVELGNVINVNVSIHCLIEIQQVLSFMRGIHLILYSLQSFLRDVRINVIRTAHQRTRWAF